MCLSFGVNEPFYINKYIFFENGGCVWRERVCVQLLCIIKLGIASFSCWVLTQMVKIKNVTNNAGGDCDHDDEDRKAYQNQWSRTVRPQRGSRYPSG